MTDLIFVQLILSSWYKKEEQSKRFAFYISAAVLSGAFGGIIAGAITGYGEYVVLHIGILLTSLKET